jgi:hypothetical protein
VGNHMSDRGVHAETSPSPTFLRACVRACVQIDCRVVEVEVVEQSNCKREGLGLGLGLRIIQRWCTKRRGD